MKRKNEDSSSANSSSKKRAISDDEAKANFRNGLFDTKVLEQYTSQYANSEPYKHCVISNLIDPILLRSVREEILSNLSFTPKETDIYKIHQSGDLANLDGLDDSSLKRLPFLLKLRDSLYSSTFRKYVSTIAHAGPLSGVKTDMAINVYTPGCHLLCHDDVIGSRRVSYILYLLDPDLTWKSEWGGALRLFPTENFTKEDGTEIKVPTPDHTVVIPPAFNQLSFFTVQPGESFHDVEEVYKATEGDKSKDGGRIRMAISGWFHIPQKGEEGYEEGLEEKLAERSSLMQLQGKGADKFDLPQSQWREYESETEEHIEGEEEPEPELSEEDLQFLLKYMTPHYLTPDTVEELASIFTDESSLRLSNILSSTFSARLRTFIESAEKESTIPAHPSASKNCGVSRPPHKHRYLYRQPLPSIDDIKDEDLSPYDELVEKLFPSPAFKKWLALATNLSLSRGNIFARRFRRGMDYTLATAYEELEPQLEVSLGITPTTGWAEDEDSMDVDEPESAVTNGGSSSTKNGAKATEKTENGTTSSAPLNPFPPTPPREVGGYEMYMSTDDPDFDVSSVVSASLHTPESSTTGGGFRPSTGRRKQKADPAVYRAAAEEEDEDGGVLFSMPAAWNNMSIVLRDTGTLKFVKYISSSAPGDRWDVVGEWGVEGMGEDDDDEDEDDNDK